MTDLTAGPLYFFDQPRRLGPTRRSRIYTDPYFDLTNARLATVKSVCAHSKDTNDVKTDDNALKWQNKADTTDKPDISASVNGALGISSGERNPEGPTELADCLDDINPIDAYKHVAPHLLSELGSLLLQYQGLEEECIPYGLLNVLNYSWKDLTAGAIYIKPSWHLGGGRDGEEIPRKTKACVNLDENLRQMTGKRKTKTKPLKLENGSERHLESKLCKRASISHENKVPAPTTISFSISSKTCDEQGWIVQPKETCCEEAQWADLYQRMVERLKLARTSIKLQTKEQAEKGMNRQPILRHYGDAKPLIKDQKKTGGCGGGGRGAGGYGEVESGPQGLPYSLWNAMPQIPKMNQEDHNSIRQKLHYGINDGSSFIYYVSGRVAVCQSHSALPCGGFYTNVFSDHINPVILASVTASGRGTVTHPLSSAVTAMWDQNGGQTSNPNGAVTKKWTWPGGTGTTLKDSITIQVSDQISVRLLSGTCALLVFRGQMEMVQLPLSPLSHRILPKETACLQTEGVAFTSPTADYSVCQGPVHSSEGPVRAQERAKLEQPCPFQRGAGRAGQELRRLQKRVFKILDDWLEFYRNFTGIKCPDMERMPDRLVRPRQKRVIQSTTLGSLKPTKEMSDSTICLKNRDSTELQTNPRHLPLTTPADVPLPGSTLKLSRTLTQKKQGGEKRGELLHFCQPGTSRIHNNVRLDSVGNLRRSPELHPIALTHHYPSTSPCGVSRLCPAQLRAILMGEEGPNHRRCRCSSRLMPLLTDLEFDAFIRGQPPHSEQILVVCVTPPFAPHTSSQPDAELLDRLYQRRNRNRTMPCYQSQLDSFRLVRYELSAGKTCPGTHNVLLQQRHNVAPGMFLMYNRGKLLFADYMFNGYSCSVGDLQKQISKTRVFYRMGQSLPPDYRFSGQVNSPSQWSGEQLGTQMATRQLRKPLVQEDTSTGKHMSC